MGAATIEAETTPAPKTYKLLSEVTERLSGVCEKNKFAELELKRLAELMRKSMDFQIDPLPGDWSLNQEEKRRLLGSFVTVEYQRLKSMGKDDITGVSTEIIKRSSWELLDKLASQSATQP